MFLDYDSSLDRFIAVCTYEEKDIVKSCGFWWDRERKHWFTSSVFVARSMQNMATERAMERLRSAWNQAEKNFAQSHSFTPREKLSIPKPEGLNYKPYQELGILFAHERRCSLNGDDMGLGKTIQAIGLMNLLIDKKEFAGGALIVCPASLKRNWERELRKWLIDPDLSIGICHAGKEAPEAADIVIVNYDILYQHIPWMTARDWTLVVGDEAHYVKNKGTRRAEAFYELDGDYKLGLTGTPIENKPIEIFQFAKWLDPRHYPSEYMFSQRYCGYDGKGATNLVELNATLRSTILLRRLKSEVLKDLPPKIRQVIELPASGLESLVKEENDIYDAQRGMLDGLRTAMKRAKEANDTQAYQQALNSFRQAQGAVFAQLAETRKKVALAKLPYVIAHVQDCIEQCGKMVVFAHHHEVLDRIYKAFPEAIGFDGRTPLERRQKIIDAFQENDDIPLFVGGLHAAGVGITLTAASLCVFAELDYKPSVITQCEDRLHRIGQEDCVTIHHLVLEGSLDMKIAQAMVDKQAIIDRSLNDKI